MATWREFESAAPELATAVSARSGAHKHHVLATLRADGSPRVSGTEVEFLDNGTLRLGSMLNALKARDLQRDPRYAIHTNPGDHSMEGGDAKISGHAVDFVDPEALQKIFDAAPRELSPYNVFDLDITEVVLTEVVEDQLKVRLWKPGAPVRTFTR
ncbi:pyridoxamine 5'-phosphate oxidase family protein [Rhodococcus sp. H29-C3]|uniref:pyridoxamine 5'-phosphate oxidase family protein n=1 Tax=Rhodococcus sp. H29-C3 TaxID=3046307 RepID=UPI0024B8F11A|nr:pyridoxamine 5'-phosphate oxidase family protein [Rhodococcus sp. H29-C3]MDJ0359125.1 pyridoxamine 5'-phosphate oxidase family protein [Rhodococcus sp. H29-C3]